MDEFYGGYNYTSNCDGTTISAADNVEDVDDDDVIIIDGLTKRFRLPGWRVAWIIGPKEFIKAIGSCGSYLDGMYIFRLESSDRLCFLLDSVDERSKLIPLRRHKCTVPGSCGSDARTRQGPS